MKRAVPEAIARPVGMRSVRDVLLATERLQRLLATLVEDALGAERLNVTQWLIVSDIAVDGGSTLTQLARLLAKDPGSLSRVIYRMVERGLLANTRNAQDRRSADLRLTSAGRELFERVSLRMERLAQVLNMTMGSVSLDMMVTAMDTTIAGLKTEPPAFSLR